MFWSLSAKFQNSWRKLKELLQMLKRSNASTLLWFCQSGYVRYVLCFSANKVTTLIKITDPSSRSPSVCGGKHSFLKGGAKHTAVCRLVDWELSFPCNKNKIMLTSETLSKLATRLVLLFVVISVYIKRRCLCIVMSFVLFFVGMNGEPHCATLLQWHHTSDAVIAVHHPNAARLWRPTFKPNVSC